MLSIGGFFNKIQNKFSRELFVRSTIQEIVKKVANVDVPVESISIKSSDILLKGISQTALSQIFIKKQRIITEVNEVLKPRVITNIR